MTEQKRVKTLTGKVISNKMDKTIVVAIERQVTHRLYKKALSGRQKFMRMMKKILVKRVISLKL